jgi:hypothetical protein
MEELEKHPATLGGAEGVLSAHLCRTRGTIDDGTHEENKQSVSDAIEFDNEERLACTVVDELGSNERTDESTKAMRAVTWDKNEVLISCEQQTVHYFNSSSLVRICASMAV